MPNTTLVFTEASSLACVARGDEEDVVAHRAAELRARGEDPRIVFVRHAGQCAIRLVPTLRAEVSR